MVKYGIGIFKELPDWLSLQFLEYFLEFKRVLLGVLRRVEYNFYKNNVLTNASKEVIGRIQLSEDQ